MYTKGASSLLFWRMHSCRACSGDCLPVLKFWAVCRCPHRGEMMKFTSHSNADLETMNWPLHISLLSVLFLSHFLSHLLSFPLQLFLGLRLPASRWLTYLGLLSPIVSKYGLPDSHKYNNHLKIHCVVLTDTLLILCSVAGGG